MKGGLFLDCEEANNAPLIISLKYAIMLVNKRVIG